MGKNICIYCSASNTVDSAFFRAANKLGTLIATRGHTLVYGGGCVGLMGEVAKSVHHCGGEVIGVIPEGLRNKEVCYEQADELIVTKDMRERKATMEAKSDAFITIPGGFGTLEEILEMITARQLGFHNKPLVIVNINGFYDPLVQLFEHIFQHNFANANLKDSYYIASDIESAVTFVEQYSSTDFISRW
ncbi:MAG: Rossman fold protein, TIGR00730 family [Candidatus Melainabacteria bacterium RIFOXYA2_FULL_32_9]|nr:MAG: Rossman fold protein, TIGR00730 family [Candidatus Melainabacteria bacterium RIFOXYA2_FULL_32_9]